MKFALGKCKNPSCKYFHGCPIMLPCGKPCGQPHTAAEHAAAPHWLSHDSASAQAPAASLQPTVHTATTAIILTISFARFGSGPPASGPSLSGFVLWGRRPGHVSTFRHVTKTWSSLLSVLDGQPFRLNLWHCLSLLCADPDSDYFHVLREGVLLGIGSIIPQCSVSKSAWKSAIDNADVVDSLLASELQAGWIREIPGGDEERRSLYKHTAVGKLGVVLAPGRPPRLVVDSSVSGITSNMHLPNRSANPSLMDVRKSIPLSGSLEQLVALVLDVAKAHRRILIRGSDRGLHCFRHRGRL